MNCARSASKASAVRAARTSPEVSASVQGAGHKGPVPERDAFGIAGGDAVHKGLRLRAGKGLDREPRGLVESEKGGVLEDDARTDGGIRAHEVVLGLQELADGDLLAAAQLQALGRAASVDEHLAAFDGLAHEGAGRGRICTKQNGVQPDAALLIDKFPIENHQLFTYSYRSITEGAMGAMPSQDLFVAHGSFVSSAVSAMHPQRNAVASKAKAMSPMDAMRIVLTP